MKTVEDIVSKRFRQHLQKSITLNDADFEEIIKRFTLREISKKEYLIRPLQVCRYESYIAKGLFQTAITDDSGRLHTLYFPHEDWWVGDFKSFKKEEGSSMEIQALEDSVLLQISKPDLENLYRDLPVFERFFRILNENAGIALQDRIVQNFSVNAEKKYLEFQKKYPEIQHRLSAKRIASFLGVTPEYFSQLLNKK
ncbi:Crp/Fnr family transcriptional regulator [Negadavirga shengliensis]|uniref:Crp/Fnr family transcriptional regulator n=1 Tax=Negadavirga shengliensis TaxID=1389218 RepID=A0ABV9T7L1_9BACT